MSFPYTENKVRLDYFLKLYLHFQMSEYITIIEILFALIIHIDNNLFYNKILFLGHHFKNLNENIENSKYRLQMTSPVRDIFK